MTIPKKALVHAIVFAPVEERAEWIERELTSEEIVVQTGRSVRDVIAALVEDPAPRPQILVIDLDALDPGQVLELHSIREQGWCGTIFALGKVPPELRRSLRVELVPAMVDNVLRLAIAELGFDAKTRKLPIFRY